MQPSDSIRFQDCFINQVRRSLGRHPDADPRRSFSELFPGADDTRVLATVRGRDRQQRLELLDALEANARAINLEVIRCTGQPAAAQYISELALRKEPEYNETMAIIRHEHPLLRQLQLQETVAGRRFPLHVTLQGEQESRSWTEASSLGITVADWGVADSATLIQMTRPGQPRSTSLVPSIHVAVLQFDNLLADLREAYALIRQTGVSDSMVFISGPSKTADIEATMVYGAHGPREVHLLVLGA